MRQKPGSLVCGWDRDKREDRGTEGRQRSHSKAHGWAEVGHQERDVGSAVSGFAVKLDLG